MKEQIVMSESCDSKKLYAIPMMVETQKEPLKRYCFGSCGKISLGGVINIDEVGPCWVCSHDDCPYEKAHTEIIGSSEATGDLFCVRGLELKD